MDEEPAVLRSLQQLDAGVRHVVAKARHVVTYSQNPATEKWERDSMEGALYVVTREGRPRYALCILNRLSPSDLYQPLVFEGAPTQVEFEFARNFLIYRVRDKISAIWFATASAASGADDAADAGASNELETVRLALERIRDEHMLVPPQPQFVSLSSREGDGLPPLSRDEMREALLKLLSNDTFVDRLYQEYVEADARKRRVAAQPPPPPPPQPPPHLFVMPSSPYQQQQHPHHHLQQGSHSNHQLHQLHPHHHNSNNGTGMWSPPPPPPPLPTLPGTPLVGVPLSLPPPSNMGFAPLPSPPYIQAPGYPDYQQQQARGFPPRS